MKMKTETKLLLLGALVLTVIELANGKKKNGLAGLLSLDASRGTSYLDAARDEVAKQEADRAAAEAAAAASAKKAAQLDKIAELKKRFKP